MPTMSHPSLEDEDGGGYERDHHSEDNYPDDDPEELLVSHRKPTLYRRGVTLIERCDG
jgi:hypothetical protein